MSRRKLHPDVTSNTAFFLLQGRPGQRLKQDGISEDRGHNAQEYEYDQGVLSSIRETFFHSSIFLVDWTQKFLLLNPLYECDTLKSLAPPNLTNGYII